MSAFCEDERNIIRYPQGIFGEARQGKTPLIRCLQWGSNLQDSEREVSLGYARELIDIAKPDRLRVVFMANCFKSTSPSDRKEFLDLSKHYNVRTVGGTGREDAQR